MNSDTESTGVESSATGPLAVERDRCHRARPAPAAPALASEPRPGNSADLAAPAPRLTHPQRAERRLNIARAVAGGRDVQSVAVEFGVTVSTVCHACREHGIVASAPGTQMSHRVRARRREAIVKAVSEGGRIEDVARAHGVRPLTVVDFCHQAGVSTASDERSKRPIAMAAAVAAGRTMTEVAREHGVTIAAVHHAAVTYGGHIPGERTRLALERRRLASEQVRAGRDPGDVAREMGISLDSVRDACGENGVTARRVTRPVRGFVLLAELLNSTDSFNEIAERTGATFDTIQKCMRTALAAGIRFPQREALLAPGQKVWRMQPPRRAA